jgi:poly-beta-1,6-N-acetyl-D-glucosamine synthase
MTFFIIFILPAFVLLFIYAVQLLRWSVLFSGKKAFKNINSPITKVSVIIPFRDEEKNLKQCIKSILAQDYPGELLEIIFANDHSTDKSCEILESYPAKINSYRIVMAAKNQTGKKAALEYAIQQANGELIITTDADCIMNSGWVRSFVSIYESENPSMITGIVKLDPLHGIFQKLQGLEFLSLSGTGAASVLQSKPLMCNGANLAFSRDKYFQVNGYSYGKNIASGDDTFLMLKMAAENKKLILFNGSKEGVITSAPQISFTQLFMQRKRWISKVKFYNESYIRQYGLLVFSVNISLLMLILFSSAGGLSWKLTAAAWLLKYIPDFIFLLLLTGFTAQRKLLLLFLPAAVLYPLYILTGAIISIVKIKFTWKGREYSA